MERKIIDLSDNAQYPANVLTDLNYSFALGDDFRPNMLWFLQQELPKDTIKWENQTYTKGTSEYDFFLFRAFSLMHTNHRARRDAMIAAEGCEFVWKNTNIEPIPGLLSGDKLCNLLTMVRERDMNTMKHMNDYEDRDARRWRLIPTYDDLMAELIKNKDEADYYHRDMGCGMFCFRNKAWGNKQTFIVNIFLKKAYNIVEAGGKLVSFTHNDIDWDSVNQLKHNADAKRLTASYSFSVGDYKDDIARVDWMIYPDGSYFADETGFGREDNNEVNISAYIDTECHVLIKFQDMEDPEKAKELYKEAYKKVNGKG